MPIFEYRCGSCEHEFEALIRSGDPSEERCPACGAEDAERLVSLPGIQTEGTRANALQAANRRKAKRGRERVEEQRRYEQAHEGH